MLEKMYLLLNQLSIFAKTHESLTGSIIGAFFAAIFGILAQQYKDHTTNKNRIKRYGKALFHDFNFFIIIYPQLKFLLIMEGLIVLMIKLSTFKNQ